MGETSVPDSIKKRLSVQNEVLKRLKEFSEKLQLRANDVSTEIHGLSDQARVVELDLKNTFNSFRILHYNRYIDHRISDEDDVSCYTKESPESSAEAGIPAQNYETDILPRYQEALLLGLSSCKSHLENTKRNHLNSSVFSTGSAHGQLPHIIGSEEYIHDNSCGLTEDFALGTVAHDLSCIMEPKGVSSDAVEHDSPDLFDPQMFGMQQGSPDKDGTEPLVSAASDFKAMLEAALLNTYKFYDDESVLVHDPVSDNMSVEGTHNNVDISMSLASDVHPAASSQQLTITEGTIMADTEVNLTSLQDTDELYSSLVSGSLFDTEEESLSSNQQQSADVHALVAESISGHMDIIDDHVVAGSSHSPGPSDAASILNHNIEKNVDANTSLSINDEERNDAPEDEVSEMSKASKVQTYFPCEVQDNASLSLVDSSLEVRANKEECSSDRPATECSEGKSIVSNPVTLQDMEVVNSPCKSGEGSSLIPAEDLRSGSNSDDEAKLGQ